SSYTSLGFVILEEEVSQALLFLNKQMKESSSPSESHNLEINGYSPDEPSIFEDSIMASPLSLANM
ncbi:Hypothetical protein FKW44_000761, partial [Caligus rogercresseyi]